MNTQSSRAGAGCAVLFALPFVVIGLGAGVLAVRTAMSGGQGIVAAGLGLFGIVFAGAGLAIMFAAIAGTKRAKLDAERRAQYPEQPWMWKESWAAQRIHDQSRSSAIGLWIFTIIWNAFSSPLLFVIPREFEKGNYIVLIGLLFPLVGLALLFGALHTTMQAIRFKRSTLVLDALPIPVGGVMRGHVEVPYEALTMASSIDLRLTAVTRHKGRKSTTETISWQEERAIDPTTLGRSAGGVSIPIEVPISADAPAADLPESNPQVVWRLQIDADLPGVDYSSTFEVPVFRTATLPEPSTSHFVAAATPISPPAQPTYVERDTPEGVEMYFPPFRAKRVAFGVFLFTFLWTGAIVAMVWFGAPIILTLIFGAFDLVMLFSLFDLLFASTSIILGSRVLVRRRMLFWSTEHELARGQLQEARLKISTQTTGGRAQPYYEVELVTTDGKSISAANDLRNKREAEWVAARIRQRALQ